jgi:hypothetical protein
MYTNGATCLSVENCLLTHINKIIETFDITVQPPSDNGAYIEQLDISLDRIHKNAKSTIIFSEDLAT